MTACGVCGQTLKEHKDLNHEYDIGGVLRPRVAQEKPRVSSGSGIDVVLRLVLIDRGYISADDLMLKEAELRDKLRHITSHSPE